MWQLGQSSKTKGLHWGSLHRWENAGEHNEGWVTEWWSPPKRNLFQRRLTRLLVPQWGGQRSSHNSDRSCFASDMILPTDSALVVLSYPSPLGSGPILRSITKLTLKRTSYGARRMATEQQGFCFCLYFFKQEPHCAHRNVEYFHRDLFPAVSHNETWNF